MSAPCLHWSTTLPQWDSSGILTVNPDLQLLNSGHYPLEEGEDVGKHAAGERGGEHAQQVSGRGDAGEELREAAGRRQEVLPVRPPVPGGERGSGGAGLQQLLPQSPERHAGGGHLQPADGGAALHDNGGPVQRVGVRPPPGRRPQLPQLRPDPGSPGRPGRGRSVPHPPGLTRQLRPRHQVQHGAHAGEGQYVPVLDGPVPADPEEDEGGAGAAGLLRHVPRLQAFWGVHQTGTDHIWSRWRGTERLRLPELNLQRDTSLSIEALTDSCSARNQIKCGLSSIAGM